MKNKLLDFISVRLRHELAYALRKLLNYLKYDGVDRRNDPSIRQIPISSSILVESVV